MLVTKGLLWACGNRISRKVIFKDDVINKLKPIRGINIERDIIMCHTTCM